MREAHTLRTCVAILISLAFPPPHTFAHTQIHIDTHTHTQTHTHTHTHTHIHTDTDTHHGDSLCKTLSLSVVSFFCLSFVLLRIRASSFFMTFASSLSNLQKNERVRTKEE